MIACALRRRLAAAAAVAVAVVLAALVLPRAFGGPTDPEGEPGPELRVLAANAKFGDADPEQLAALVRDNRIDALAVSELTDRFAAGLERAGIGELVPHSAIRTGDRATGTGLYSRLPLSARSAEPLPGGFTLARGTVEPPDAPPVELVAVHTVPPTGVTPTAWADDLAALPAAGDGQLRVLLGDFNATLDHAEFRALIDRGYDDAAATLGDGLAPTWPANRRLPPLVTIDHVLADERIGVREYSVERLDDTDHRPVFAALQLPGAD